MRRIFSVFLCLAGIAVLNLVSGCGGGTNTAIVVTSVKISPTIISLTKGQTLQITAQALNSKGVAVNSKSGITFNMTPGSSTQSPANLASISNNGLLCGGTWDSVVNPVVCQIIPAPQGVGSMTLTATADGVTSDAVTVFVHEQVTSVSSHLVSTSKPVGPGGCISQGTEARFTASVLGPNGVDITPTVGPINFVSNAPAVASVDTTVTPAPPATDQNFKANVPGKALIFASVSGTNGIATPLFTCSPAKITIAPASTSIAAKGTATLTPTIVDVNGVTITNIPLTWSSSHTLVATVDAAGKVTATSSPGLTYISAACAPPNCNLNEEKPEFSNLAAITVTGTAATPIVEVASSATPTSGVTNLVPLDASSNTVGTPVPFATGQVPNSMTFGQSSSVAWLATNTGIVAFDPSKKTFTATGTSVKGTILALSPNAGFLAVSDTTAGIVHIFNTAANSEVQLNIPGATAAAWTPDNGTLYIAAGNALFVYMPSFSSAPTQINLPAGVTTSSLDVLANGQLLYMAENAQFEARAVCDRNTADTHAASPDHVLSLPDGSQMIGTDTANVWGIGVTWTPQADVVCVPPLPDYTAVVDNWAAHAASASFHARQIIVTPDSKHVYITNDTNNLLAFNPATGAVTNINIGAATFTGASTVDSTKVYVGAADGKVHVITTSSNTDTAQVAITGLCTGPCLPDLVAVQQN